MKMPSVFCALALSAALQLTMSGLTRAQSPSPIAAPDKAAPTATATASPSATAMSSPVADQVAPIKKKILDQYDANHNGTLDADEKANFDRERMVRRADRLKKYDKNHDGRIDDNERAAMRMDRAAEKGGDKASPKP